MAQSESGQNALEFYTLCAKWAEYPNNLVHPSEFEHELDSYQAALNDPEMKLFHLNKRMLHIWSMEKEGQSESSFEHPSSHSLYR